MAVAERVDGRERTGASRRVSVRQIAGASLIAAGLLLLGFAAQGAAARATDAGTIRAGATPVAFDGGNDADDYIHPLGTGPLDEIAAGLAENGKNTVPPTPSDADLGGVAATGLLLLSAGGATLAGGAGGLSGLAGGGPSSPGGSGGPGSGAPGGPGSRGPGSAGSPGGPSSAGSPGSGGPGLGGATTTGIEHARAAADVAAGAGHGATTTAATAGAAGFPTTPPLPWVGGITTAATSGLPLPRPELIEAGLSIYRSMKRVTSDVDPAGYGASDLAELIGDATAIGALASILAPAANLIDLATAGVSSAAETADPREVVDRLRRSFGQLGYMQGVLDENVGRADGKLTGLDGAPEGKAAEPEPPLPPDVGTLTFRQLREGRETWAVRADIEFDALIAAEADLAELDNLRRNLGHQIDAVNDLLANLDDAGTHLVPHHLADTLRYGLGWYKAGDPDRMISALREVSLQGRIPAQPAQHAEPAEPVAPPQPEPKGKGSKDKPGKGKGSAAASDVIATAIATANTPARRVPFREWAPANGFDGGRISVLESLAGLERWCGFYDALSGSLQNQIAILRARADTASATRRTLSAEIQHRTLEGTR